MESIIAYLSIKWWVALAGIAVHFIVGMLWYGPIFGQRWMKGNSLTDEDIKESPFVGIYIWAVIASLVATYGLAFILNAIGVESIAHGLLVTIMVWITLRLAPNLNHINFEGRPKVLLGIDSSNDLVAWLLTTIIIVIS